MPETNLRRSIAPNALLLQAGALCYGDAMRLILPVLFLALSACAPRLVQSSSAGGMISLNGVMGEKTKSAELATAECQKYGKASRLTGQDVLSDTVTYECVAP